MSENASELLTKQKLIRGREYAEDVDIKELGGKVRLRSLTDGEFNEVKLLGMKAIKASGVAGREDVNIDLDIEALAENQYLGKALIAAYGLSVGNEKWSPADVKKLPVGSADQIAKEVLRITNISEDELDFFRPFRGGGRADDADSERVSIQPVPS